MKLSVRAFVLAAAAAACMATSAIAQDGTAISSFRRETGISVDAARIQQTWQALEAMGTTKYVGGMLGSFQLDESSLIAGALTIGAAELDSLLNGGGLNVSAAGVNQKLISNMTAAQGINLSTYTGSFTNANGGRVSRSSLLSGGGAMSGSGSCDTSVASGMASTGKAHVDKIVTAALSKEYGFSEIKGLSSGGGGTGFGALGCLDKLFQNAGSDIMFKPPSLGSLTSQIQNWACSQAESVADQVAGAFGDGEIFNTAEYGGFYPSKTYGESADGGPTPRPGIGQAPSVTFGSTFAAFETAEDNGNGNVLSMFK